MSTMFNNLKLNEACKEQHNLVREKGFEQQLLTVKLMLTVSELSEALEADRKGRHADLLRFEMYYSLALREEENLDLRFKKAFEHEVKDTVEDEIADTFLRLMDLCGEYKIDIERHIRLKAQYNKLRKTKHGKKY